MRDFTVTFPDLTKELESLSDKRTKSSAKIATKQIKAIATDVDGILTNGCMYYSEDGLCMKAFHTRDAASVQRLRDNNVLLFVITHSSDEITRTRLAVMRPEYVIFGTKDKLLDIKTLCMKYDVDLSEVLYIGDDYSDIPAMRSVGYSVCPSDALPSVVAVASNVLRMRGGSGVLAQVVDMLINGEF